MQQVIYAIKNIQETLASFVTRFHKRECVNENNIVKLQHLSDELLNNDTDLLFEVCLLKLGITEEEVE